MNGFKIDLWEVVRGNSLHGALSPEEMRRAIEDGKIPVATMACVRFVSADDGAVFSFSVVIDASGMTTEKVIADAWRRIRGRVVISSAP